MPTHRGLTWIISFAFFGIILTTLAGCGGGGSGSTGGNPPPITPPAPTPTAGWTSKSGYVYTRGGNLNWGAVYDPAHQHIFSGNELWNRVDVTSDKSRTLVKSIPIQDPRGLDISIDGKTVWVFTGYQAVFGIDTTTLQAKRYQLPLVTPTNVGVTPPLNWYGQGVFSLADGTVLLAYQAFVGGNEAIWDPATNSLSQWNSPLASSGFPAASYGIFARSGDGTRVFSFGGDENETSFTYNAVSKTFTAPVELSSFGYASHIAVNRDGTRAAVTTTGLTPFALYDNNLNLIGLLPGDGGGEVGGTIFSPDGATIYEETDTNVPVIAAISTGTLKTVSTAPAMPVIPPYTELSFGYAIPHPFAVDADGMVLGTEWHGIAFDDSTAHHTYTASTPAPPQEMNQTTVYSGSLAGGTVANFVLAPAGETPDTYFGATLGTSSDNTSGEVGVDGLNITSPAASVAGPVDLKFLYPDGTEVYDPLFFTYGVKIQDLITTGGSPQGGSAQQLDAFGISLDPSTDTVTVGGNAGAITSQKVTVNENPFTDEVTARMLNYTAPSGSPGRADVTVTTPGGTDTVHGGFLFAKSVTSYSMSDKPSFVLYDGGRNQLYLSAGSHIDVFSLSSSSFLAPLQSPAGATSIFEGLAMTPDGHSLLAADAAAGGMAVFNLNPPASSYEISIPTATGVGTQCLAGPMQVAADNAGNALVVSGRPISEASGNCSGVGGPTYKANLAGRTATPFLVNYCGQYYQHVSASSDGSVIGLDGGDLYLSSSQSCIRNNGPSGMQAGAITVSGDGVLIGVDRYFEDSLGDIRGRMAFPPVFYPAAEFGGDFYYNPLNAGALPNPHMNDAGSLYYWAYPGFIDIIDVPHGLPALRFALTQTVSTIDSPMEIDGSGQHIYLITKQGLTVVDLGNAPLAIGHLSDAAANPGAQIVVRGSGFENGITARLGSVAAPATFTDSETLTITIPAAPNGPQDLVVTNPDKTTYTLENALIVE